MTLEPMDIGGGVYASFDGYHIVLTTWRDGKETGERVFLDPGMLQWLQMYVDRVKSARKQVASEY